MSRRARTLPTPGSDSSTLTTFSLARISSRSPWSNSSGGERAHLELLLHLGPPAARDGRLLERGLTLLGGERGRERHRGQPPEDDGPCSIRQPRVLGQRCRLAPSLGPRRRQPRAARSSTVGGRPPRPTLRDRRAPSPRGRSRASRRRARSPRPASRRAPGRRVSRPAAGCPGPSCRSPARAPVTRATSCAGAHDAVTPAPTATSSRAANAPVSGSLVSTVTASVTRFGTAGFARAGVQALDPGAQHRRRRRRRGSSGTRHRGDRARPRRRRTVVGMSWSLRSTKTRKPLRRGAFERVGARRGVELEPHLDDPEPRRAARRASASASSGRATSSASARRSRTSVGDSSVIERCPPSRPATRSAVARDAVAGAPVDELVEDAQRARGSRNVAVPTPTALAPASSISTASSPVVTPPVPMIGTPGNALATSCTARNATGLIAGPERPPPPRAEDGPAVVDVDDEAEHRVHEREPGGAGRRARRRAISRRSVTLGDSLAKTGRPSSASTAARTASAVAPGRVREHARPVLEVRAAHVHLERDEVVAATSQHRRGASRTRRPCVPTPTRSRARRAPRARAGRASIQCSTPGPCRPTALSIPAADVGAGAAPGCPPTRRRASDFTVTAPSRAGSHEARDLVAVAERARRRDDRVREHDRSELDRGVDRRTGGTAASAAAAAPRGSDLEPELPGRRGTPAASGHWCVTGRPLDHARRRGPGRRDGGDARHAVARSPPAGCGRRRPGAPGPAAC